MIRIIPPARRSRPVRGKPAAHPLLGSRFVTEVVDLTSAGAGVVVHPSGLRLFVMGAWPEEQVEVEIEVVKQRFGKARLLAVHRPSPERTEPPCPYYGTDERACGGCPWQFVTYEAQLKAKQRQVVRVLDALGVASDLAEPIWPSERRFGYRTRAQLKTDGTRLGYVAAGSRDLVDVGECPVLTDVNRATLGGLRAQLPNSHWRPQRRQEWSTLDIDETVDASSASLNQRLPFQQANAGQNQRMRAWLRDILEPLPRSLKVLELFAGSGNFTEVLADAGFDEIVAVEAVAAALKALEDKALPGVSTQVRDLFAHDAVKDLAVTTGGTGLLVLDPPRDGMNTLATVLEPMHSLRHILYISCDLATFRRDAEVILQRGYRIKQVQPVDLFPQTPHVEVLTCFERPL